MKVLSCYSIKGGVGKTALAVNLAYALREGGARVLLMDLDPQSAAGFYFRVARSGKLKFRDLDDLALRMVENIRESDYPGLDILPSALSHRKLDQAFGKMDKSRTRLRSLLAAFEGRYDWVVLDCPANITLLAENVFVASDLVLVPVIPTPLSIRTLEQLLEFFRKKGLPGDKLLSFASMVQKSNRLHQEALARLPALHSGFLNTGIPLSTHVERMGEHRAPLLATSPTRPPALSYSALYHEILDRLQNSHASDRPEV